MSQHFTRTKEDFTCGHCGAQVMGDGYTNHCPRCLWSAHVDVYPGDRAESCGGLMKPIQLIKKGESFSLLHRCSRCGEERSVRSATLDDLSILL